MIDRRVAVAVGAVEPDAELVIRAEAAAGIDVAPELAFGGIAAGEPRQRLVAGALGDQVYGAAEAAPRRHAVQQCAAAFEDLDPLDPLDPGPRPLEQAEQPIDAEVGLLHRESADEELVGGTRYARETADGWVVERDIGEIARLLVADQLFRVGGLAERGVEDVAIAQEPDLRTSRYLPAGKWRRRGTDDGVRRGAALRLDRDGVEHHNTLGTGGDRLDGDRAGVGHARDQTGAGQQPVERCGW